MIKKITKAWVDYMIRSGAPEENRDIYEYGLECTLNELASDVLLLVAAVFLHRVWQMLLWIAVFNIMRIHVGGYHAKTPAGCLFGSTMAGIVCVMVYPLLARPAWLMWGAMIACNIVIWMIAPVTHPNHPVSEKRLQVVGKRAKILGGVMMAAVVIFIKLHIEAAAVISTTCVAVCLLSLVAYSCTKKGNS